MILTTETEVLKDTRPNVTLFTINPRWIGLWSNPRFTRWEFGA